MACVWSGVATIHHHPEISKFSGIGILLERSSSILPVGITKSHDIFSGTILNVGSTNPTNTYSSDVEFIIG